MNINYILRRIKWMNKANEELKRIFKKTKIKELEGIYWEFKECLLEILRVISLNKSDLSKKGKPIICKHCGYNWVTRSKAELVACPKCANKTRITELKNEEVICFKCKKKLNKKDAEYGYLEYFHKNCYQKFKKESIKEVSIGLKKIL